MRIINRSNLIIVAVMAAVLIAALVFAGGCRDKNTAVDQARDTESAGEEGASTEEDTRDGGQEEDESAEGAEATEEEDGGEEEIEEEIEEEAEIPEEISSEIEEADSYFNDGMYSEAVKGYRDAQRAIENSELAADKKEELLAGIDGNYQEALNISNTAMIHHSSAMTLIYEKRYEEAKAELETALAIYPKYQTAIDALDSLEALMGLK